MTAVSAPSRWFTASPEEALRSLQTDLRGLSETEASARLETYGPNLLGTEEGASPWIILLHQFASPLIYILLIAMVITIAIQHYADSIVIGIVVGLNAVIGFTQEYRAENAIRALMGLTSPKARVRRDGRETQIESSALVPGDIVLLTAGNIVPADFRLIESTHLQVNESLLTGESAVVTKRSSQLGGDGDVPLAEQRNMAFMGTAVTSGRGVGVVVATGGRTQVGAIAEEMRESGRAKTPLQERMVRFGHWISAVVVAASAVTFVAGLSLGEPLTDMFLTAVSVAVSAIPEGLPVVMTIALAVGVRRMSNRNAIIRRLPAVEALGSCTVILSDKTGTITQNQMTVQEIWAGGERYLVSGSGLSREGRIIRDGQPVDVRGLPILRETLLAGMLPNEASLESDDGRLVPHGDPTEVALLVSALKAGLSREDVLRHLPILQEIPFEPEQRYSASIHRDEQERLVFVKGAPERVLSMCDNLALPQGEQPLDREGVLHEARTMAENGLRVLAMAVGKRQGAAEATGRGEPAGLTLVGLQGMMDPPREEAVEAIKACRRAGIRIIMVTGDHVATAAAIASKVSLAAEPIRSMSGQELEELSDEELSRVVREVAVFARVDPGQKLRLVNTLREQGEIVAVTGDGVNDAPALKSAHIGSAMGRSGTDVAKEASEMVLTDDNFATIYAAVEEGRTAFSNIRKATFFLISSGAAELLAILASIGLRMPLPLLPVQILWLNVVTNGVQDVALAFEPGEEELFRRPPRDPKEGILSRLFLERTALVGIVMATGTLGMFAWEANVRGLSDEYARVAALSTMVMFQVFHVFNSRSENLSILKKGLLTNPFLLVGTTTALLLHIGATYLGPTQFLLDLEPLDPLSWSLLTLTAFSVVLVVEAHKRLRVPR